MNLDDVLRSKSALDDVVCFRRKSLTYLVLL